MRVQGKKSACTTCLVDLTFARSHRSDLIFMRSERDRVVWHECRYAGGVGGYNYEDRVACRNDRTTRTIMHDMWSFLHVDEGDGDSEMMTAPQDDSEVNTRKQQGQYARATAQHARLYVLCCCSYMLV
jgi:hypothetical protein